MMHSENDHFSVTDVDTQAGVCCSPNSIDISTPRHAPSGQHERSVVNKMSRSKSPHVIEQVPIVGGTFLMGDSSGDENLGDGETPTHAVTVDSFEVDATAVTNSAFEIFVEETGYKTEAEAVGFSAVFSPVVSAPSEDILGAAPEVPWWYGIRGANWRHPEGVGSSIEDRGDHPVVHVSWNDASAYCFWAGRRLLTEAEWEYAARGGLKQAKYPWGDVEVGFETWRANIFQGSFPLHNTGEDGWLTTAPVKSYSPNGFGLWQTVGNVWEWCSDWYSSNYYKYSPGVNPKGPVDGEQKVLRGGSFLCHDSYCDRYRNSA